MNYFSWSVEMCLVRLGGTGRQHCRVECFGLLRIGSRKSKMPLKWQWLCLMLALGVWQICVEQLPSQLLNGERIFIPLRMQTEDSPLDWIICLVPL